MRGPLAEISNSSVGDMAKLDENDRRQLSAVTGGMAYPGAPNLLIFGALFVSGELTFNYSDHIEFGPDLLGSFLILIFAMSLIGGCMSYSIRTIPRAIKGRTDGLAADVWWYGVSLIGSIVLSFYTLRALSQLEQNSTPYVALGIIVLIAMFFLISKGKLEGTPEDFGK